MENKAYKVQSIKNWAQDDRPREKLTIKGKNSLSDSELLAIIIGSGSNNESAVELSKRILYSVNKNWNELAQLSINDLCKFKGIGEAKAISIITALEIGKRRSSQTAINKISINHSQEFFDYLYPFLGDLPHEEFWVIYLNQSNKIIAKEQISKGGITFTAVDYRIILKKAIESLATSLLISHNHPSGSLVPSKADEEITQKIKKATTLLDIQLLDHIIVGNNTYFSFKDNGKL